MDQNTNQNNPFFTWEGSSPIIPLANWLKSLSPVEFSFVTTFIAIIIAQGLSLEEITVVASFLRSISIIVSSYATQIEIHQEESPTLSQYYALVQKVQNLQKEIEKMKRDQ